MTRRNLPPNEFGFSTGRNAQGQLVRGPIGVGTPTNVQFTEKLPPGIKLETLTHSHPKSGGGSILPSRQDMSEAARIGVPALCIVTEERAQCYAVKGTEGK